MSLTDEGRIFYDGGRLALESIDDAEAAVAGQSGLPRGILRLTAPGAFGRVVVLPIVSKYLREWPAVQVEVSFSDGLAEIVEEGFDLAVRIGSPTTDSRLVTRVVARHRAYLCAAPSYLDSRGTPTSFDDLAGHDGLIFSSRNRRQHWHFHDDAGEEIRPNVKSRLRLDSGEAIRDAALAGLGIAFLPDFLVAQDIDSGTLRKVLPRVASEDFNVVGIYPNKRFLDPRVRRFLDLLAKNSASRVGRTVASFQSSGKVPHGVARFLTRIVGTFMPV